MTRLLSRSDVQQVLNIFDTIEILESAFADLSNENANMPQRTPIVTPDHDGLALFMPAYLKGLGALGAKVVTVYKNNPKIYNLSTVLGTIILLDEKTGATIAIMDGGFLTAMRTGGVAGLATKLLAKKDSKIHALFGTGAMAGAHVLAVDAVRNIEKLFIHSIDPAVKKMKFKDDLINRLNPDCEIILLDDPETAVKDADIVTLITSAKDPVIRGEWIKPGTHINGVGSHAPSMREVDTLTVQNSKVVCDLVEACAAEAGDLIIPVQAGEYEWSAIHGSLGDVVTNKIDGRVNDREITFFKSVGLAIQDISVAFHVYQLASKLNVGVDFAF
jgi:ornithine cyclodeaminase/alanine dehydrogenase-like protein (mu-crystallin family)